MTCANPDSGRSCLLLDSYFSDGLPCGLAGTCEDGSCNEGKSTIRARTRTRLANARMLTGSLGDRIKNWITKNKQYSIRKSALNTTGQLACLTALP